MAKTATRSVELEPIDRLEEKLKRLVGMIEQMRTAQARAAEENQRLTREIESMRARLASGESAAHELSSLKEERDLIRTRVGEMLEQLAAEHSGEVFVRIRKRVPFGIEEVDVAFESLPIARRNGTVVGLARRAVVAAANFSVAEPGLQ